MTVRQLPWAALTAVILCFGAASVAHAQGVVVQGQVQVQTQPQGQVNVPPGYGASGRVVVQPTQPAPTYAPTYQVYQPRQRQLRYEEVETSIKGLWIPGIIIFGVSYVLTGTMGSTLSFNPSYNDWSWVPLIGPWVALGYANNDDETTGALIGGIAQAAGLTMFILGLAIHRTVRVARYVFNEGDDRSPELAFDVLPAAGGGQLGLTLSHF